MKFDGSSPQREKYAGSNDQKGSRGETVSNQLEEGTRNTTERRERNRENRRRRSSREGAGGKMGEKEGKKATIQIVGVGPSISSLISATTHLPGRAVIDHGTISFLLSLYFWPSQVLPFLFRCPRPLEMCSTISPLANYHVLSSSLRFSNGFPFIRRPVTNPIATWFIAQSLVFVSQVSQLQTTFVSGQ